jgi:1-acyl-sn-glycerol-3-phosphate acyltransferase
VRVARRHLNAIVVALGLAVALPAVAVAERVRPTRGGRTVALGAVRLLQRACGVRVVSSGRQPSSAVVIVANHLSLLDVPALLASLQDVPRFVAAAELFRVPLLRSTLRALGAVELDRGRPAHASRRLAAIAATARPIVVFAQGAISKPGEVLPFKTGAFILAIDLGVPVVPVAIRGTDALLPRGRRFAVDPGTVTVRFLDPVATTGLTRHDRKSLRDGVQRDVLAA